jgi:hypothetical protein
MDELARINVLVVRRTILPSRSDAAMVAVGFQPVQNTATINGRSATSWDISLKYAG